MLPISVTGWPQRRSWPKCRSPRTSTAYEQSSRQAVRFGNWKAIRDPMLTGDIKIFDLASDLGEKNNLASSRPDLVEQAAAYMREAHVPHPNWNPPSAQKTKARD